MAVKPTKFAVRSLNPVFKFQSPSELSARRILAVDLQNRFAYNAAMIASVLFVFLSSFSTAAPSAGCFETHLRDARAINKIREAKYEAITAGRSKEVSEALMALEQRMLIYQKVRNYDRMSEKYDSAGIHVTCDAVVSMTKIQEFRGHFSHPRPATLTQTEQVRTTDLPRLSAALALGEDVKFRAIISEILTRLARQPQTDCLYRHFLESLQRIAALKPIHAAMATAKRIASPTYIHRQMLFGHLLFLPTVVGIDARARTLNGAGVSIICDDIPQIPLP